MSSATPMRPVRMYPRVPVALPVEIEAGKAVQVCESVNLSAGGVLISCKKPLPSALQFTVRLNLPTGDSIHAPVAVVHHAGRGTGLRFLDLGEESRSALAEFTHKMMSFKRRGERMSRRVLVTVSRGDRRLQASEEMAETIVISRYGGLLVCRAHFAASDSIYVYSPDRRSGAAANVISVQGTGKSGLIEVGFEFAAPDNFWGVDFEQREHS